MAKIKIKSDPYKREITFESFHAQTGVWEKIGERNPDSRLREDESEKSFLPFKIKEIVDTIIHDYHTGTEQVEIVFEGTNEEFREVEKVCLSEGIVDKVIPTRTHRILENARSILKETKEIFRNVEPIIAKIVRDDAAVCGDLKKVSDALDDIIPICVFGNYSAGKSTFINALIGSEILPSGGDPVTAKIYEIRRSDHPDVARIHFSYRDEKMELLFDGGTFRVVKGNVSSDILVDLCQIIKDYAKEDLTVVVNKALEFINSYERKDKKDLVIGSVITVAIPFSPNGILGQSQNHFVIFDTPGSNSATNTDHSLVLEEALQGFSNGIPVWVSQYESMDSEDNAALCDRILAIKALDKRFTMIVLNKADGSDLPENGFSYRQIQDILEYRAVEKMYASGIFFVSSIMGLGAKNNGNLRDKHYRRIYRSQKEMYADPDDLDYATLYNYDIMPEQIKNEICRLSAEHGNPIYANSGLFCIEREMEDFASKYSAYNKCQMVFVFLNEVIEETNRRITNRTNTLKRNREKRQKELDAKRMELITTIGDNSSERERSFAQNSKTCISAFVKNNLDYSYNMQELDALDGQVASKHADEANFAAHEHGFEKAKGTMWSHLKSHSQNLFSREFVQTITSMKDDLIKDFGLVQASRDSMSAAQREIDSQTSDDVIRIVNERYRSCLIEAVERLSVETRSHWQMNAQSLKEELIDIITESDALSNAQRAVLSGIIMDYQPLVFSDDADDIFIKTKFLRGSFWGIQASKSERLNIRRLTAKYNERISKSVLEMASHLNENCHSSYITWQTSLLAIIEDNIAEYNPQLRDMSEMIREETEKIVELETDQQTISASLESIRQLMSWKDVEFEEMHYGS